MRIPCLLSLTMLAACSSPNGQFPSLLPRAGEVPRVITDPGEGATPNLSAEEKARLLADIEREEKALAEASSRIAIARSQLDSALGRASGAPVASNAWVEAQLALSRFDSSRAPLGEISARLPTLQILVDSLPESDPDRLRVEKLQHKLEALMASSTKVVERANDALKG